MNANETMQGFAVITAARSMIARLTGRPMEEAKPRSFEQRFESALAKLDDVADGRGMGIDAGIREPVAALLALGHGTSQSCEGHLAEKTPNGEWKTWATGGPYIDVFQIDLAASRDERMRVAKATGQWSEVSLENRRKGAEHTLQLDAMLDEFYSDRQVDPSVKLITRPYDWGTTTRIESRGVALQDFNKNDPVAWDASLKKFQVEMQSFGVFLLDKGLELDAQNQNKSKLSARSPG
jgi:hypothetical protein